MPTTGLEQGQKNKQTNIKTQMSPDARQVREMADAGIPENMVW